MPAVRAALVRFLAASRTELNDLAFVRAAPLFDRVAPGLRVRVDVPINPQLIESFCSAHAEERISEWACACVQ